MFPIVAGLVTALVGIAALFMLKAQERKRHRRFMPRFWYRLDAWAVYVERSFAALPESLERFGHRAWNFLRREAEYAYEWLLQQLHKGLRRTAVVVERHHRGRRNRGRSEKTSTFLKTIAEHKHTVQRHREREHE